MSAWLILLSAFIPFTEFKPSDLYGYIPVFRRVYPNNRHLDSKIRQGLQELRDRGLLVYHGRNRWSRKAAG